MRTWQTKILLEKRKNPNEKYIFDDDKKKKTTEKNVGKWKKLDFISYSSSAMAVGKQKKTFDLFHVHTYNMHIIMSREFCYHLATII